MDKWEVRKLRDLTSKIGSGATPRGGSNEYKKDGISLIRSQNVLDFQFSYFGLAFIDEEQADALKNVMVEENDVLLNITGDSVARCCIVPINVLPARVNQHVSIIRLDPEKADYIFIFYLLQALKEEFLMQAEIGATRRALTKGMIEAMEVTCPPLPEQKAIAAVLSCLDDKIDLLHRQNKTLEAIAETIFRQWFVEKAQEDWEEKPLSSIAEHKKINITPKNKPVTNFCHYSIPSFDEGKNPINELGSEIKSNKNWVFANSILISKLNPRFPRVWGIRELLDENSICSTEFQVVLPNIHEYYSFIYCFLKSKKVTDELISAASGTSGSHQRVKPEDILNLTFQMPTQQKIDEFNLVTSKNWKRITNIMMQIRTLEKLRDTLLPKLMSGEVRVKYDK